MCEPKIDGLKKCLCLQTLFYLEIEVAKWRYNKNLLLTTETVANYNIENGR